MSANSILMNLISKLTLASEKKIEGENLKQEKFISVPILLQGIVDCLS